MRVFYAATVVDRGCISCSNCVVGVSLAKEIDKIMSERKKYHCFFCEEAFEYEQHHLDAPQFYPVRKIDAYRVDICRRCATDQIDGVDARHEYRLVQKLKRQGLPVPARNPDGLLPMPFAWASIFNQNANTEL